MKGFASALGEPAPQQNQSVSGTEAHPASIELQAEYNQFVGHSMAMLWDDNFIERGAQMLKQHPDVADAIANITILLIQRVMASAFDAGKQISVEVLLHGGQKVVEEVGEFAMSAGVQGVDVEVLQDAFVTAARKISPFLRSKGYFSDEDAQEAEAAIRNSFGDGPIQETGQRLGRVEQRTQEGMRARGSRGEAH